MDNWIFDASPESNIESDIETQSHELSTNSQSTS